MTRLLAAAKKFFNRNEAASLVEYGLLVALIAVVCILAVTSVGGNAKVVFEKIAQSLTT
jgi:pilus assembly protein Flp/PilA